MRTSKFQDYPLPVTSARYQRQTVQLPTTVSIYQSLGKNQYPKCKIAGRKNYNSKVKLFLVLKNVANKYTEVLSMKLNLTYYSIWNFRLLLNKI